MANRKKSGSKPIEIYKHKTQKRKNNPQVGIVSAERDSPQVQTKQYKYDPNLDPELVWAGKAERLSFEVPTVPLHIHEKIDPRSIIETVRNRNSVDYGQMSLFHDSTEKRPLEKEIEFYKHEKLWSNRLVAGDSLVVMSSLLEKEEMAGKVQCVYIDPPYGIKYGSNFQPFTNKRDVKDKKDEDLTAEPEMIKAFRDTWELGIHSYLSYLRDRLLLAKDLLTESGSCFVQISDENVHLVRNLMDEIFGRGNFVSEIIFRKKQMPLGSKYLETQSDFILWYTKNKAKLKYNKLYKEKNIEGDSIWKWIELADHSRRKMTTEEINSHKLLPENSKIFRDKFLEESKNAVGKFQYNVLYNGKKYFPKRGGWVTHSEGMAKLLKSSRIVERGSSLGYILYYDDYPVTPLMNVWNKVGSPTGMIYVVQTNPKVIERCVLMTTKPGDLVLDPTCGSGTTAYAAEKWGRRWITCDTSRVAIALAKQRLMTAKFDYYKLKDEKKGINEGFNYKEAPHITLKSIANNPDIKDGMTKQQIDEAIARHASKETLYDQPYVDKNKFRVSGPFTVEAVPAVKVETLSGEALNGAQSQAKQDWLFSLKEHGIKGKKGLLQDIEFTRLEIMNDTRYIFAEGETKADAKRAIVCFGSEYAPLEQRQVELALKEAKPFRPDIVIFCAFQFDPEAGKDVDELALKWTNVLKVQMNSDLFTEGLKKKTKGDSFWLVGQPDVSIKKIAKGEHKGKYTVSLEGFDYYNTKTNSIQRGGKDKIAMWMLDTNYDGRSLYSRQVFFPLSGSQGGWERLKKNLRSEINEDLIDQFKGTESLPFKLESHKKIAVKIIDDRGIESLVIKALD